MKRIAILLLFIGATVGTSFSQKVALKTNLLYGAATYTPNLGVEVGLGRRTTLEFTGGYNPWNLNEKTKKLVHWMAQAEFRYWFCERFNGAFIGVHALGSEFNIAGHKLPMVFGGSDGSMRYQGNAYGGGISIGYQFILARRWNLELNVGGGYARINYDKYDCMNCDSYLGSAHKDYFGLTRAGVTLVFLIGKGK